MERIKEKLTDLQLRVNEATIRYEEKLDAKAIARERCERSLLEKESIARRIKFLQQDQKRRQEQLLTTETKLNGMEVILKENEAVIAQLSSQNEILRIDQLEDSIRMARTKTVKKQSELEENKRRMTVLKSKLKQTLDRVTTREAQVATLIQERDSTETRLDSIITSERQSGQRQDEMQQQTEVMRKQLREAEREFASKRKEFKRIQTRKEEAEQQLAAIALERTKLEQNMTAINDCDV